MDWEILKLRNLEIVMRFKLESQLIKDIWLQCATQGTMSSIPLPVTQ
jgi:hypothetical protein